MTPARKPALCPERTQRRDTKMKLIAAAIRVPFECERYAHKSAGMSRPPVITNNPTASPNAPANRLPEMFPMLAKPLVTKMILIRQYILRTFLISNGDRISPAMAQLAPKFIRIFSPESWIPPEKFGDQRTEKSENNQ